MPQFSYVQDNSMIHSLPFIKTTFTLGACLILSSCTTHYLISDTAKDGESSGVAYFLPKRLHKVQITKSYVLPAVATKLETDYEKKTAAAESAKQRQVKKKAEY